MENNDNIEEQEPFSWKEEIIDWVHVLIRVAIIVFILNHVIFTNSNIPSGSMERTIMTGDRVIGSRLTYRLTDPERGDVVIFYFPDDTTGKITYTKRIIGIPGDIIDIRAGRVYLNNSETPLVEPYLPEPMEPEPDAHYEVPDDCYFMLGDNRNISADARRWKHTYVKRDKVIAKVLFRYFPTIRQIK